MEKNEQLNVKQSKIDVIKGHNRFLKAKLSKVEIELELARITIKNLQAKLKEVVEDYEEKNQTEIEIDRVGECKMCGKRLIHHKNEGRRMIFCSPACRVAHWRKYGRTEDIL